MNWITSFLKPKIKALFKKKSSESKENLWTTCECKQLILKEELLQNLNCCAKCSFHHPLTSLERFKIFFDDGEFEVLEPPLPTDDPLKFVDSKKYIDRIKAARKLTKQDDAVAIAKGKLTDIDVTVGAQDFRFMGGSFGAASGEAFVYAVQHSIENKTPFIFFASSGGQKMQESLIALSMMSKTVLAVNELKKHNIPYIVILTTNTMGGVLASWASLGDILIGEHGAQNIGFAGKRVIQDTIRETLPPSFQSAEFLKEYGQIDLVVERKYLRSTIGTLLSVLLKKAETQANTDASNVVTLDKSVQRSSKAI